MQEFIEYIRNKSVLIVGNAPDAIKKDKDWYNSFDIIVRMNNYKKANDSKTNIFFSYFGKNVRKTSKELLRDGVRFCINKCPNLDMSNILKGKPIDVKDYRWIYDFRKNWWFCPVVALSEQELLRQIDILDGNMPTTGLAAVLYFLTLPIKSLDIIGFDCFESNIHNLDEMWDRSGNHRLDLEKMF